MNYKFYGKAVSKFLRDLESHFEETLFKLKDKEKTPPKKWALVKMLLIKQVGDEGIKDLVRGFTCFKAVCGESDPDFDEAWKALKDHLLDWFSADDEHSTLDDL